MPAEATATAGRRYFSIDGFAEGRQHISARVTYKVFETVAPGGANSVPPTDSEMTQALAIMQEIRDLKTPKVTVGQTKTVAAAQPARVVNTGTDTKAVFDFEIPRGESGVYVGSDEPGEDVQLWIVPEGENEIDEGLDVLESTVKRVENATVFAPKIGADGTWLVYDSVKGTYVDTGVSARGTQGEKGEDGTPGQDGKDGKDAVLFVQADEPTDAKVGDLWFDTDEEVTEPSGASSWNDLTDKPFGTVEFNGDLLPETQGAYNELVSAYDFGKAVATPVLGSTCTVYWDGMAYTCVASDFSFVFGDGAVALGNMSLIGLPESTGEPFLIAIDAELYCSGIQTDNVNHTVRIAGTWYETKKIDSQYIPSDVFVVWATITGDYVDNSDWSIDKTYAELYTAYSEGRILVAKVNCSDCYYMAHLVEFDVNKTFHFANLTMIAAASVNKRYMFSLDSADCLTVTEYTGS